MENLFYISEVYGPRVNNSRNHRAAAEWAMQQMKTWGAAKRAPGEVGGHSATGGKLRNSTVRWKRLQTPR